jgi:hypothetical protein
VARLRDGRPEFDSRQALGFFSFRQGVQNGSGAHLVSYPMSTEDSSTGVKRPGHEADHSPPSSAEVNNAWSYIFTPRYVFIAWYLFKNRDNFTFTSSFSQILGQNFKQTPTNSSHTTSLRLRGSILAGSHYVKTGSGACQTSYSSNFSRE